jgi:hypothetical protein
MIKSSIQLKSLSFVVPCPFTSFNQNVISFTIRVHKKIDEPNFQKISKLLSLSFSFGLNCISFLNPTCD